ncbi:MAG: PAS domain S-box protein [bacterium]
MCKKDPIGKIAADRVEDRFMKKAKKGKIAHKIFWPFVIIFTLLIISFMGSLSNLIYEKTHEIILKEAETKMNVARQHFENSMGSMLEEMRDLSALIGPSLSEKNQQSLLKDILRSMGRIPDYYVIQIFDPDGRLILENIQKGYEERVQECFNPRIKESRKILTERVSIEKCGNDLAINLWIPISHKDQFIGYIRLHRQFGHLFCQQVQKELNVPVYLFVDDQKTAFPPDIKYPDNLRLPGEISQKMGETGSQIIERIYVEDKEYIAGFLPFVDPEYKGVPGRIMILIDTSLVRELSMGVIRTGSFYGLVGVLILIFMGFLIAKGITLPLVDFVGMAKKVGKGNLDVMINTGSNDELEELANAFNRMTQDLKKTTVSKDYVDNIIRSMMDPLFLIDRNARIRTWNRAFCDTLGYEDEEIIGMPVVKILPEKERILSTGIKDSTESISNDNSRDYETYLRAKDGREIPVLLSRSVMEDKEGRMICIVCTAKDISQRKAAEEKLRENQEYLKRIWDSIHTGIMIIDRESNTIFDVNPIANEMIGALRENIIGASPEKYMISGGHFKQDLILDSAECLLLREDGTLVPILKSRSHVILNGREYFLETFIDITERKRVEGAIRQRETAKAERERLFSLLEMMPALMALYSPDYSIPFANRRFREVFGDPTGRSCYEIFYKRKEPCKDCITFRVFEKKELIKWEWTNSNGRTYELYDYPYTDIDGSPLVLELGIDITDRKKAEKAKEKAEHRLEEQRAKAILSDRLRSLGEMATGIAHELNQPLSGVRGLAEHLLIGFDRGWNHPDEVIRENIEMIIEQTDRMSHVIDHARMFARGAGDSDLIPVKVNEVIRSAEGLINAQLRYKGLRLECDLATDLPPVLANPFSLEEVVLNVINNARDAIMDKTKTGGKQRPQEIMLRTQVQKKYSNRFVMIEIIDHGIGIPKNLISKIFAPFFTTKSPDKGTGVGLAVSKAIIDSFQGEIRIKSRPGSGTIVSIILPVLEQKEGTDHG